MYVVWTPKFGNSILCGACAGMGMGDGRGRGREEGRREEVFFNQRHKTKKGTKTLAPFCGFADRKKEKKKQQKGKSPLPERKPTKQI
jgi:hypothetical protein